MELKGLRNAAMAVALLVTASASMASVSVDENGIGFVGKGDVQAIFDWNNSELQQNAGNLTFRFASSTTVSWKCEGINKQGKVVTSTPELAIGLNAEVGLDARKNKQGQITGFNLLGFDAGQTTAQAVGTCGASVGFQVPFAMVEDSVQWEGSGEPTLQVSADGETWFDLPITY